MVRVPAAGVALLLLFGSGSSGNEADRAPITAPEFQLPNGPAEAVIRISWSNPLLRRSPTTVYTLFGDGRLERASLPKNAPSPASAPAAPQLPGTTSTVVLDAQEMHELAALAARPALVERDPGELATEFHAAGAGIMDGAVFRVHMQFTSYSRGTVTLGPFERDFALVEPLSAAEANPRKEAVQALARLVRAVVETHKTKEAEQ
ncbi:MAG TPA: hypothetical protein VGS57_15255 [Thermoanaerobaculia bacterium]|jgi:hypothetical protein|nr:hypothetical protein [Thermoanaerobaculia bacterium]